MTAEESSSVADELLARLPESPDSYPQKLDLVREMVLLVRADAGTYRSSSFLDDRMLGPATTGGWVSFGALVQALRAAGNTRPVHFIFHTGHVGSTLVSRLLDETGTVLSLREPMPLRTLADAHDALGCSDSLLSQSQFDLALAAFMRAWRRGYDATRCVVVKATSSAGRLAIPILAADQGMQALYLNLRPEPYLAAMLAGQNSPADLRGHGPGRMRRLQARIGDPLPPLHSLSIGELAAMSWLAESCTQHDALERFAGRVAALDFDEFLSNVAQGMEGILAHFGLPRDVQYLSAVGGSPVLTRYSKAPEHAYSPSLREEVLRDSRRLNREEIRKGMAWLERRAQSHGAFAQVFDRAGASSQR